MYFILIDRFVDGDPDNNAGFSPDSYLPYDGSNPDALKHYQGGDLKGILQSLDGLADMGITMIWISPFLDNSNRDYVGWWPYHGYHPIDFYQVDEHFGTREDLKQLVQEAHTRGLKVVFDMPFNQTAQDHPWLSDPEKQDWFHFNAQGEPLAITDWQDQDQIEIGELHGLPDLAQEQADVEQYLIDVSKYWIEETGCDGFRLDAVKHIPVSFWKSYNAEIKGFAGSDFLLFGEVFWGEPERIKPYAGLGFDLLFDIPGYYAIRRTVAQGSSIKEFSKFYWETEEQLGAIPLATLIDNHDVARFNVGLGDNAWEKQKLALGWLMTRSGIPVIYYGTEIGMPGYPVVDAEGAPQDFLNRMSLPKELDAVQKLREQEFSELTHLRLDHPVLVNGSFHEVYKDWSVFAFLRSFEGEQVLVVLNTAGTEEYVPMAVPEALHGQSFNSIYGTGGIREVEGEWWVKLAPMSMSIWELSQSIPVDFGPKASFTDRLSRDYQVLELYLLDPSHSISSLQLAGDFNNWRPGNYENERRGDSLFVSLPIKPGTYQYKFVVDGTEWIANPNSEAVFTDPYGGQNSVLQIQE